MTEIAVYSFLAIQFIIAVRVFVNVRKDIKRKHDYYEMVFMTYLREYQRMSSKAVHEELNKYYHCQQLVKNNFKK